MVANNLAEVNEWTREVGTGHNSKRADISCIEAEIDGDGKQETDHNEHNSCNEYSAASVRDDPLPLLMVKDYTTTSTL